MIDERTKKAIHILRNPFGWSNEEQKRAAWDACKAIERLDAAYENMRQFAEANGLDTTCRLMHNAEVSGAASSRPLD